MNIGPEVSVAGMEAWDAAHKAGVRDWPTMLETVYLAMRAKDAAVAELIEADKEYDAANEELTAQTDDEDGMYSLALERLRLASSRRAVAIARVGGA